MFSNDNEESFPADRRGHDRREKDKQRSLELMERILTQYEQINKKFDTFIDKYTVPLEYVKEELEKKKRRDQFLDNVQENVMVWLIVGVLTGLVGFAAWIGKLIWATIHGQT